MSITYTWFIDQMKITQNPKPDFVADVSWGLMATDGTKKAVIQSNLNFEQLSDVFVPYENLTEEVVIDWVKNKLGAEMIADYEASLEKQIEGIDTVSPISIAPLPWAQS